MLGIDKLFISYKHSINWFADVPPSGVLSCLQNPASTFYAQYIFRHTYAKLMARNGCPSIVLAHCLTHASVQQSEHYVNLYGNELRQACDKYNPVVVLLREKAKAPEQADAFVVLVDDQGLERRTQTAPSASDGTKY